VPGDDTIARLDQITADFREAVRELIEVGAIDGIDQTLSMAQKDPAWWCQYMAKKLSTGDPGAAMLFEIVRKAACIAFAQATATIAAEEG
jgi:hypothetical protein